MSQLLRHRAALRLVPRPAHRRMTPAGRFFGAYFLLLALLLAWVLA